MADRVRRRAGQTVACGWCGQPVVVPARGRVPKWCSNSCRHRAWEQSRAAGSGRVAVEVVTRTVEVERTVIKEVPVPTVPSGAAWPEALGELARQVDTDRVYDRDLPRLAAALEEVSAALGRRSAARRRR